jgi:hypothetical protein
MALMEMEIVLELEPVLRLRGQKNPAHFPFEKLIK